MGVIFFPGTTKSTIEANKLPEIVHSQFLGFKDTFSKIVTGTFLFSRARNKKTGPIWYSLWRLGFFNFNATC